MMEQAAPRRGRRFQVIFTIRILLIVIYNLLLVVVHQEMLHLALAGNLLRSIGESGPHLYSAAFLPTYGGAGDVILHSKISLKLECCGKGNLERFLKVT
jgi:hypothetical protein